MVDLRGWRWRRARWRLRGSGADLALDLKVKEQDSDIKAGQCHGLLSAERARLRWGREVEVVEKQALRCGR